MGKNLKGKDCGRGITQRKDGKYYARFTNSRGNVPMVILLRFQKLETGWMMPGTKTSMEQCQPHR